MESPDDTMDQVYAYIDAHQDRFLEELFELLRVPSVVAQGMGIDEAALLVKRRLQHLGAEVQIFPLNGSAPLIYATLGEGTRRLLIYDHYDVQPAEPFELWQSPPFQPTVREGKIYARGVADNKGNLMLRLQALEAWLAIYGRLPLQIVFVIEGEEEIGSPTLPRFCEQYPDLLRADGCLWETGGCDVDDRPKIDCGVKGIQYIELVVRGAANDMHSSFGTVVPNPAWRLTWALASMKAADEHVLIPGFYDRVRPPSAAELEALTSIPPMDDTLLTSYGLPAFLHNLRSTDMWQRHLFEPTCTICGLVAGYTGDGSKTVLPSEARAKVDFRLVPDMQPQDVLRQVRDHLDAQGYSDIAMIDHSGAHPWRSDVNSPMVQAVAQAAQQTYGSDPVLYATMAGSGPMHAVNVANGTPVACGIGCGYYDTRIHAPNENARLEDYWQAMRWMGQFVRIFAG